jgi:tetratricopeptide (TPR) repeat protein
MLKKYFGTKATMNLVFLFSVLLPAFIFISVGAASTKEEILQVAKNDDGGSSTVKERQVIEINSSLKNVIEENQTLVSKNQELAQELEQLREQNETYQKQYNDLKKESYELAQNFEEVKNTNDELASRIENLETASDAAVGERAMQLASAENTEPTEDVTDREAKTLDLLQRIDAFSEEDGQLRSDAAKAHYNMGNIYFQKGKYEIAAREYYQAVALMPEDPDAHYNLAFVSGEYLQDYKTALKHYQIYLYLNPGAKDADFVKEKMLKVKLALDSIVNSPLENKDKK